MGLKNFFNRRDAPQDKTAIWFALNNAKDVLCPDGYTPISKVPEVQMCIHRIADLVSSMTLMLMSNGTNGDERIYNGISSRLDIEPCKYISRKNFYYRVAADMLENGNAIAVPKIDRNFISSIDYIPQSSCTICSDTDGYCIRVNGVKLHPDEVLHFAYIPDDSQPWRGIGLTPALKGAVETLLQANATKKGFLKSKWKPSMIISIPSDVEELRDEEKRNKILGSYISNTQQGEPWLIPAGEIDVKTINPLSLKDLSIQNSIELDLKTIAAACGVPPFVVGIGDFDKAAYNNFISNVIMPIAQAIEQELTRKLLVSDSMYFKFKKRSLMQYDLSELTNMVTNFRDHGIITCNEGRAEINYAPIDGGDEMLILENYIPAGSAGTQKKLNGGD